jgi:hypothetical protein
MQFLLLAGGYVIKKVGSRQSAVGSRQSAVGSRQDGHPIASGSQPWILTTDY